MRKFLMQVLNLLSRLTLAKFKPLVIGITGSVGKTSTKEAVAAALSGSYSVRKSYANYNNEFGIPYTILGQERTPGRHPMAWLRLVFRALWHLVGPGSYPQVLVLEMGSDRPGDIKYLLDIVGPIDYAIVTDIGISHLKNYSGPEALAREKLSLVKGLKKGSVAIVNIDNEQIAKGMAAQKNPYLGYGLEQSAELRASDLQLVKKEGSCGLNFKMHYSGTVVPFFLPDSLGRSNVYAALAAAAIGLKLGLNLVQVSQALHNYQAPAGRLRLIPGIKRTQIIDDTYNAAPASTMLALEVLRDVAAGRKVAALGAMAELGDETDAGHRRVAVKIQEAGVDVVFLVGQDAKIIVDELERRQFNKKVLWFENSDAARMPIQNALLEGDTILVKGSQSARMEKIVKEIMAEPLRSAELLVRQDEHWLK